MEITGILKVKNETQQISDRFRKREFVLTDNSSQYSQHIQFQLTNDKCELLDQYAVGSELKVHFGLRGREWISPTNETKYFNTLDVWRIEGNAVSGSDATQQSAGIGTQDNLDDLPF